MHLYRCCIYEEVSIFLRQLMIIFLRHPVPAETNCYLPATPGPRLTHSQKPTCDGVALVGRHVFAPTPLPGDMAVVFLDVFFCPLRTGLLSFPFYFGVPCRLRSLAVQSCGSGFCGSVSSTHVRVRGIEVSNEFSHISAYTAHQSGLV